MGRKAIPEPPFTDAVWAEALDHRRLVRKIVGDYVGRGIDREDLEQVGIVGVCRAIVRYDELLGATFSTYAAYWIKKAILIEIGEHGSDIHVSAWTRRLAHRDPAGLTRAQTLKVADARQASHAHLAEIPTTLEAPTGGHPDLPDFRRLDERERIVLCGRYGLDGDEPRTVREIGAAIGVTPSWVSRIEKRALERLRSEANATCN